MTEAEARALVEVRVPRETLVRIEQFVELLVTGSTEQNLISAATIPVIWSRHVVDSLQLGWLAEVEAPLLDIGSGAGLPGILLAMIISCEVVLTEPRALRVAFLRSAIDILGMTDRVVVEPVKIQRLTSRPCRTITARAVAPLPQLFSWAAHCANADTRWILPRGRSAAADVADAERLWHGRFTIVPSLTDSEAAIVVAEGVRPRKFR